MSAKRLNSAALPSITGLAAKRAEIAEAEDGGAVRDDRHHVAAHGVVVDRRRVGGDRLDRHGDARRIGERQDRAGSPSVWSATISSLPGRPREWNCSASWSVIEGRLRSRRRSFGRSCCGTSAVGRRRFAATRAASRLARIPRSTRGFAAPASRRASRRPAPSRSFLND